LNHLTIPVKDRYRAARFYIVALGAEAHHESAPDRVAKGLSRSLQFGIRMAANFEIDLFEQDFGQPDWNQSHPHLALDTSAEDLEKWVEHFKKWHIPFVGPMTRAGLGVQRFINDPMAIIRSSQLDSPKITFGPPSAPRQEPMRTSRNGHRKIMTNERLFCRSHACSREMHQPHEITRICRNWSE
jgi:hypothetical protein